jgi:diguanylate cyclase (GGDEF)-like protein
MSFRLKTMLGITLIQALLLFTLIWNGAHILTSSHEEALLKHASTATRLFASVTQDAVLATDLGSLENAIAQTLLNPGIVYARVAGKEGILAEGGDPMALAKPFKADHSYQGASDGIFDASADIIVATEKYGHVEVGFSIGKIKDTITSAQNETMVFSISAMAAVALLSYLFAMYLTRRLDTLKAASQCIAEGALGHQIPVNGTDELAQTAAAFNEMSHKLRLLDIEHRRAENEIKQLNTELEARVTLRTHQLASANKALEHLALHDALTKLPNRTLFHDRVEQAILIARREKKSFALLSLDLDKFKPINDTLGHHTGDLVLQEVAIRMGNCLRQSDTVARMGGDEFSILLLNITTDDVMVIVNKIIRAIIKPIAMNDKKLAIGASIGIAMFPAHGDDLVALMCRADSAMYAAKRAQNVYTFYNEEVEKESGERLALQQDLRRAIDTDQLILHYQPKIDFGSQRVIGVEALVRWQHPQRGLIYPDAFITIVEKNGLMKAFTLKVLEIALRQCELWHETHINLSMAINISAINLQDPVFPDSVAEILKKFNVAPTHIELEITETAIMTDPLRAIENITKLSAMGLQVSIDDFGTGYSSMAYLQKLLVAKIKIDKSFVMEMDKNKNDNVIVRSTIDLGHNLGLKVIAEGVESQESWDRLKEMGCDSAQGYFMSRPIPADQFMQWINESPFGSGENVTKT